MNQVPTTKTTNPRNRFRFSSFPHQTTTSPTVIAVVTLADSDLIAAPFQSRLRKPPR